MMKTAFFKALAVNALFTILILLITPKSFDLPETTFIVISNFTLGFAWFNYLESKKQSAAPQKPKFIEAYVLLYNKHLDDIGVKTEDVPARVTIKVKDIVSVRETVPNDEMDVSKTLCCIETVTGENWVINKTYEEVSILIRD